MVVLELLSIPILMYVEPHRVIIKGIIFLVFNCDPYIYEKNLSKCIPLNKFEDYLKNLNK